MDLASIILLVMALVLRILKAASSMMKGRACPAVVAFFEDKTLIRIRVFELSVVSVLLLIF